MSSDVSHKKEHEVSHSIRTKVVKVNTGSSDTDGRLVFEDGLLVAVLVYLSDIHSEIDKNGQWNLEAGFGSLSGLRDVYPSLDVAKSHISQHLMQSRAGGQQKH